MFVVVVVVVILFVGLDIDNRQTVWFCVIAERRRYKHILLV